MRGNDHMIVNVATAMGVGATLLLMDRSSSLSAHNISRSIVGFLFDHDFSVINDTFTMIFVITVSALLYLFGSLLPDIDHPYSTLGRIIHIPIKHRTWTHAIYPAVIFILLGLKWRLVLWLGLGYLGHLLADSVSASGVNWLYPMKNKFHKIKLYHTSDISEYLTTGIWFGLNFVYMIIAVLIAFKIVHFQA